MKNDPAIGILRMPTGNLKSIYNAIYENGFDPVFVDRGGDFDGLTHLIVPGVGNFRAVMEHLDARSLVSDLRDFAASGRPLLGICVGMQLLATSGSEGGGSHGLGLIDGEVTRLASNGLVLPHVGWSQVEICRPHAVLERVKPGRDFYFVHSFGMQVADQKQLVGETNYGASFASIVGHGNVVGFQFHPEKSQANGLLLLENFCHWDGQC